ncbi:MAG: GGDEF domain-containing protein [Actinomycetes bacterium]
MTAPVLDQSADPATHEAAVLAAAARVAAHVAGTSYAEVTLGAASCAHRGFGTHASVPVLAHDGSEVGVLCAYDDRTGTVAGPLVELLRDLATQVASLADLRRSMTSLARVTGRDGLTGLANRRTIEQAIAAAIARAERGLGTPSVVVVDLDGFREVNETFGHAAGDTVLRSVADRLSRTARAVDTVARLGGDEFLVLLESTGGPGATAALGRLRRCLADGWGEVTGGAARISAALGITTYRPGDSVASLIARADAEMYAEKARRAATDG